MLARNFSWQLLFSNALKTTRANTSQRSFLLNLPVKDLIVNIQSLKNIGKAFMTTCRATRTIYLQKEERKKNYIYIYIYIYIYKFHIFINYIYGDQIVSNSLRLSLCHFVKLFLNLFIQLHCYFVFLLTYYFVLDEDIKD